MPKRVDRNQSYIVAGLREVGASVAHLHELGKGAPDIAVGFGGRNYFFKIKDPAQPPSKRKLTEPERRWHQNWNGQVATVTTFDEAMRIIHAT